MDRTIKTVSKEQDKKFCKKLNFGRSYSGLANFLESNLQGLLTKLQNQLSGRTGGKL